RNLAIRIHNGASEKGKLRRQALILHLPGNHAEVQNCCCSTLRTCLPRPNTECNLMTEQPGASRKKSERRSAPLSSPDLPPPPGLYRILLEEFPRVLSWSRSAMLSRPGEND